MVKTLLEKNQSVSTLQIANVLTEKGLLSPGKAKGIFQFSPTGKNCRKLRRYIDRLGNVATGTSHHSHFVVYHSHHRIVNPADNMTIMEQKLISDSAKILYSIFICRTDRRTTCIAAGHHQYLGRTGNRKKKVMQGARRQHHPKMTHPWG